MVIFFSLNIVLGGFYFIEKWNGLEKAFLKINQIYLKIVLKS